ncbi:hypothetical protein RhiirA5_408209 [Rhizophagus irregularis]|uniref:Uncharacterized protein n=1 Tax=Rhizophagus irregularis TaxID=588596 RepID=A0A2I1G1A7_9GLOM|nr:hypothetical protein RhiirA5_408209 [Rhizophagus irregularis]PKC71078.1 hypothetical protein RhiirA1_453942 [Rhizophagus irregularis]PKY13228.1 hypothetical protein RhiirB3_425003 [Rhizophagus irregularis]PKY40414.1 hypothetical protein RhiirA4_453782 [Rhizophagus irregularis]CAB4433573.1 unnamed protein product [Rhizophagus irregularis]
MNTNTTITSNPENKVSIQTMQNHQVFQSNELRLFYQAPNDDNFYHVTCKTILQDSVSWNDDDYDYEFFFQSYHVTCKLLSHSSILNILNKEIYGRDFNLNDFKQKYLLLTSRQKLNLETSLKQILPLYLSQHPIPDEETRLDYDKSLDSSHDKNIENNIMVTQGYSTVNSQNNFDNSWQHNDYNSQQDNEIYTYVDHSYDFPQYPNIQQ